MMPPVKLSQDLGEQLLDLVGGHLHDARGDLERSLRIAKLKGAAQDAAIIGLENDSRTSNVHAVEASKAVWAKPGDTIHYASWRRGMSPAAGGADGPVGAWLPFWLPPFALSNAARLASKSLISINERRNAKVDSAPWF